jgi:hypothetical protein
MGFFPYPIALARRRESPVLHTEVVTDLDLNTIQRTPTIWKRRVV